MADNQSLYETVTPQNQPGFRAAQWRMLLATMCCYLFYYTGRLNFGWVVPSLRDEFNLNPTEIGWISGSMLSVYGVGQFINGNLGDKFGGRQIMSLGAVLSVALNWITSFGQGFWQILIPWSANGYVQSLGWAPGSRLISNWWEHRERGRAFGLYVFAAGFSAVLTFALSILVLKYFSWQWVFRLPVLLLLVAGVAFYLVARNRPEDLGFAPLPEPDQDETASNDPQESSISRYADVLQNWRFLCACASIGFENMARWGLSTWVPAYYLGKSWKENPDEAWVTLSLPIGMALGALMAGYISDRLFASSRSLPIALFMYLSAAVSLAIYFLPQEQTIIGLVLLFLAGFFVYGPQSSYFALCPDLFGQRRAGTAVGVMDAAAYAVAAAGEVLIGWSIHQTGQIRTAFLIVAAASFLASVCIHFVRR